MPVDGMQKGKNDIVSTVVFIGSILTVLYALYYMQQLSVAIGVGSGAYVVGSAYNITLSQSIVSVINSLPVLGLALNLNYLMFAFSIMLFGLATLQLFQNRKGTGNLALMIVSALYLIIAAMLETSFSFSEPYPVFAVACMGAGIILFPSLYVALSLGLPSKTKGMTRSIKLNPLTPYTNMVNLSNELTARLHGNLKILDMHFDSVGLRNLSQLLSGNEPNYSSVSILAKGERFDAKFIKECRDFRDELANKGIAFETRIISSEDSTMQHERLMMDDRHAYKIPPLNIINKKSEHIVKINHDEGSRRFSDMWSRATKFENLA